MAAPTSERKLKTREEPLDLSLTEIAGENVLERFRHDLENIGMDLEMFENRMGSLMRVPGLRAPTPRWGLSSTGPIDLEDAGTEYRVHVDLPGVQKEEAMIRFLDQTLEIRAEAQKVREGERKDFVYRERTDTSLLRRIEFPTPVLAEKSDAKLQNGVLTVTVPKQKPSKEHVVRLG